jgi:predicted hydrolase (HD superfamily)
MGREEALKIVDELVQSPNIRKHCLAAESAMRALARELRVKNRESRDKENFNEEEWGLVGLLHDADYEVTDKDLEKHTQVVSEKIQGKAPQEVIDAIKGHADKAERKTLMAKAIFAADELTGLIVAAALVRPDRKLEGLTTDSVLKRMKEPGFARAVSREDIKTCETELGIPLAEFVEIVLNSMIGISKDLGL